MKKFFLYASIFTVFPTILVGVVMALFLPEMNAISILLSTSYYLLVLLLPIVLPLFILFVIFTIPKLLNKFSEIVSVVYLINTLTFFIMAFIFYTFILTPAINLNYAEAAMKRSWTVLILISFLINISFSMVNAFFAKITFNSLKVRAEDPINALSKTV